MNFLQFAVWGSYLTSMGTYLAGAGMASNIGLFYAMQGIVSLFMPALITAAARYMSRLGCPVHVRCRVLCHDGR